MNTTQELTKESQEFLDNLITGIWSSCKRAGLNAAETDVVTSAVGEALHYGVTKEATSFAARHPALFRSLVGAGIGSLGAGAATWLSNLGRKKEDRNSVLGAMATSGVVGGLGGLGYHWLANRKPAEPVGRGLPPNVTPLPYRPTETELQRGSWYVPGYATAPVPQDGVEPGEVYHQLFDEWTQPAALPSPAIGTNKLPPVVTSP